MKTFQCHILLAEDDADDRDFFEHALKELPFTVKLSTVKDGEELMQWFDTMDTLPDFLFLDLNMPRRNGFECLRAIKQLPYLTTLPVIVFSTAANPKDIDTLYKEGAQYYIRKPASFHRLIEVITHMLSLPKEKLDVKPAYQDFLICL